MKDKYFLWGSKGYQIVSEAEMHPEGEFQVVARCLDDNSVTVFGVETIDKVFSDAKQLGSGY